MSAYQVNTAKPLKRFSANTIRPAPGYGPV